MTLKKRFLISIVLMIVIPIVIMILFTILMYGSIAVSERRFLRDFVDINSNALSAEMKPGGVVFKYIVMWGGTAFVALGVSCAIAIIYLSRKVLAPLRDLKRATENISAGYLDFEVMNSDVTEVNELCRAFDDMRIRLKASVGENLVYEQNRSSMLANISHDLRTPVTSIKGYVEGLRDGVAASPEMTQRYLDTILSKVNQMQRMIDQMSDFSELELGKMSFQFRIIDISEFLRELISDYELDFESDEVEIACTIPDESVYAMLDRDKLRRVLINIFSNSIKYRSHDPLKITVLLERYEHGIHIVIADNGRGIPQDALPNIFDGFYRGDPARSGDKKGHGLGLTISKQIIERHRGKIWLKSEIDVGTEVHIHLPEREPMADTPTANMPTAE